MNLIKRLWASIFIPKNSPYCHHRFKINKKTGMLYAKSCRYNKWKYNPECDTEMEYCTLIKDFLSIQDQVKDCGINDDIE